MPQLGETVAEGKITKWFKAAGDAVKPGDNLFEIETDKTSMEVPATSAGVLTAINVQVGEVAKVGAVVAVISGRGRSAASRMRHARAALQRHKLRSFPRKRASRAKRWVPACAGTNGESPSQTYKPSGPMDPFFEVRTPTRKFRSGQAAERHLRHAAGAAARRRARHRPVARRRLRAARPHRRGRRRGGDCRAARDARPDLRWRPAHRPDRSRRSIRASTTRKCRSTACARPSRRG